MKRIFYQKHCLTDYVDRDYIEVRAFAHEYASNGDYTPGLICVYEPATPRTPPNWPWPRWIVCDEEGQSRDSDIQRRAIAEFDAAVARATTENAARRTLTLVVTETGAPVPDAQDADQTLVAEGTASSGTTSTRHTAEDDDGIPHFAAVTNEARRDACDHCRHHRPFSNPALTRHTGGAPCAGVPKET